MYVADGNWPFGGGVGGCQPHGFFNSSPAIDVPPPVEDMGWTPGKATGVTVVSAGTQPLVSKL